MTKIVMVCPLYPQFGGLETHVREISERLVKKSFDVEVVCTDPWNKYPKTETINNVKITRFPSYAPNNAFFIPFGLKSYLDNVCTDIVHVHGYNALPSYFASLTKNHAKFVFTPHYHHGGHTFVRNLLHYPYKVFASGIFRKADAIISVSEHEKKQILSDFINEGIESKINVIQNGLNEKEIYYLVNKDDKTLLYVGRIERYKNVQQIIRALFCLTDYKLNIVGDGAFKKELVSFISKIGVSDRVNFYKDLSYKDLINFYARSSIFLMLSEREAFSISTAEALACGTNCIVSHRLMEEEYIDREHCIGVNSNNVNEIVDAVRRVELIKGRATYYGKSWDEVADETMKIYNRLI